MWKKSEGSDVAGGMSDVSATLEDSVGVSRKLESPYDPRTSLVDILPTERRSTQKLAHQDAFQHYS